MTNKAIEQSKFTDFIDGLLLVAVEKGLTSFDKILLSLPGVYPSAALSSLQRLASKSKIFEKIFLDAIKQTSERKCKQTSGCGETRHVFLPVPHPLDYGWRFGDRANDSLIDRCHQLTNADDCTMLLGTPSVLARAIERNYPGKMVLFEKDIAVTKYLSRLAPKGSVINCDLTEDELPRISAKTLVCDSPWYKEYIKSFLWSASQLCAIDGYLLLSTPPIGTRPNISDEWEMILEWATILGFKLLSVEHGVLPYVSPPFECNALKAEGLHNIPGEWRCSNLTLFILKKRLHISRPLKCLRDKKWNEEIIQGVRIRFQEGNDKTKLKYPTLKSIVPDDILPSVSRWDARRRLANVWTSGNRIFKCDNPDLLWQITKSIACKQVLNKSRSCSSGRKLKQVKTELVAEVSEQINKIINLEKNEYMLYSEEVL